MTHRRTFGNGPVALRTQSGVLIDRVPGLRRRCCFMEAGSVPGNASTCAPYMREEYHVGLARGEGRAGPKPTFLDQAFFIAALTASAVIGRARTRAPTALKTASARAGATTATGVPRAERSGQHRGGNMPILNVNGQPFGDDEPSPLNASVSPPRSESPALFRIKRRTFRPWE
jgi:hypothetical protein